MVAGKGWRCILGKDRTNVTAARAGSVLLVVLILLPVAAIAAHAEAPADQEWKTAFASAKEQKRLVLVDYYATWCGPCKIMDAKVFSRDDVKEQLANFVMLRIDVDRSKIARSQNVVAMPSYIVYDPGERELIRITGGREANVFRDAIAQVNGAKAGFIRASGLYDQGKELEGLFASANAFLRLRMTDQARTAFTKARKVAEGEGKTSAARVASIQEAVTFSIDGNVKKSIKLIQKILQSPMDQETEAFAWLMLGDVEGNMAKEIGAARDAYQHVQSIAPPDSPAYKHASEALARLH